MKGNLIEYRMNISFRCPIHLSCCKCLCMRGKNCGKFRFNFTPTDTDVIQKMYKMKSILISAVGSNIKYLLYSIPFYLQYQQLTVSTYATEPRALKP